MTIYSIWTKHVTAFLLLVSQFVHKYILWIIIIYERFSFFLYSCSIYYAGWNAYTTSLYKKMCSMNNFQCEKNEYSTYHFSSFDNYCLCNAGCSARTFNLTNGSQDCWLFFNSHTFLQRQKPIEHWKITEK